MIRRPGTIVALLTGLNLLNYLDRLVVSAVLPKIQEELGLSNFMGGLLAMVFLFGYMLTAPIFGSLGDRFPRKWLITIGVLVWSAATFASGLATSAMTLILARALVGIGEASYATLAPTIIDDVTSPAKKGRALAIFYVATPVGGALGYIIGGQVEQHWGWRTAFYVAGGPGIVLALIRLLIAEPARKVSIEKVSILGDIGKLLKMPLYRQGVFGYCAYTAAIGAFSFWAPKFMYATYSEKFGLTLGGANTKFGAITVVAGAIATMIGGAWADRTQKKRVAMPARAEDAAHYRDGPPNLRVGTVEAQDIKALLKICAIGSLAGAPLAAAAFLAPTPTLFFVFVSLAILFLFMCTSPINAIALGAVPTELRGSAMALQILAIHVLGDSWSPAFVGFLADHLPMQMAMMTLPVAILTSVAVWWPRRATA